MRPGFDIGLVRGAGARGVCVDVDLLDAAAYDALGQAVDDGDRVFLGLVPTEESPLDEKSITEKALRLLDMVGLEPSDRLVVTPSCGLAGASPAWAREALVLARKAARNLVGERAGTGRRLALGCLLLGLAGCGTETESGSPPPKSDRVPITQRAIAAVALDYLPTDTSKRSATSADESTPRGELGVSLRYGGGGEYDGDLVRIVITPAPRSENCDGADGCEELPADDGSSIQLAWDEVEPEEDPGFVAVSLARDGEEVRVLQAGENIEGDPRRQDLAISVETMVELVQDPRLRLLTSQETVDAGEALTGWEGG